MIKARMAKFIVTSKKLEFEQNGNRKWLAERSVTPIYFNVSFDSTGGSSVSQTQSYKVGDIYADLPASTKAAHKFVGWLKRGGQPAVNGDFADYYTKTLSASWADPTSITWDATTNGGTLGSTSGMYWYAGFPFEILPEATHESLTFGGWYTVPSGGTKIGVSDVFSGSQTTYYAQYTSYSDPIGEIICPTSNITFQNSSDYPWSYDDTTGYDAYKCYQDLNTSEEGSFSILQGTFTGSGTLTFDVYCDTESHYDGMYVVIDDNSFYMKWYDVFNWDDSEYGESGAANVDNCWVYSGPVGWTNDCSLTVSEGGQHNVYFVFGNDYDDGCGSCEYFDKSAVLVKNVRFQ